ncbi:MAG: penicillin-binding protein 2, partial [Actinobacteria bacterium]
MVPREAPQRDASTDGNKPQATGPGAGATPSPSCGARPPGAGPAPPNVVHRAGPDGDRHGPVRARRRAGLPRPSGVPPVEPRERRAGETPHDRAAGARGRQAGLTRPDRDARAADGHGPGARRRRSHPTVHSERPLPDPGGEVEGGRVRRRGTRPALRLVVLLFIFTLLFASVAIRLVMLQIVRAAPLDSLGLQQRISTIELPAQRGAIFDRNMVPLAVSSDARAVYADAQRITDPADAAAKISPFLGIDVKTLTAKLSQHVGFVYLARKVPVDVAEKVLALRIPYVGALDETARTYPSNDLAGQVLGFVNVDNVGLSGLESMYNKILSGTSGKQVIEHDPQGRAIPQGRNSIVDPVNGKGIQTTIDRDIQFYAEQALARGARSTGAQNGTAVVLDAKTGDVLAMANWPALNPNNFGTATPAAMRNRTVTDAYEPGSVNKVITASAAIEAGIESPGDMMTVPYHLHVFGRT